MEEIDYCFDCKTSTGVALDFTSGDRICTECGLVLDNRHIDEHAEWRTFADDNNDKKDPNRVGSLMNPFLNNGNLVTVVSQPKNSDRSTEVLHSKKLNNKKPDDILVKGFDDIASMADRLGLVTVIKNRAYEIYQNVEEHKSCRGRKLDAIFAACLLIACRERKLSLPLNHFANAANGAKRKEINKAVELIKKQLEVEVGAVNAGEFVRRFCSNLGMNNTCMMAVQEAVAETEEFDIRRSPKSVLATIIYMIAQLSDEKKSLKDVSVAADVAENTIKKAYKDLYPYATRLIPNWFAEEEDVKKLSSRL